MTERASMRVMIAGGGTGGHVYPGIAVYRALERLCDGVEVRFVGAKTGVERTIFADLDLPHILLSGRAVRGTSVLSKLFSPFVFVVSTLRAVREILAFKPDVVIGTGGFASVAVAAASVICRRKRVLQEQNSVPGMTNRLLSRFAHLVLLAYQESRQYLGKDVHCAVVGNPLRVAPPADKQSALSFFGFREGVPTVLVFGGSRGAHAINKAARSAIRRILAQRDVQFVFLTGVRDFDSIEKDLATLSDRVRVLPFLEEIDRAYAVADLAVSRSGASAVFELAAFGVPAIFVPYPYAADDHQTLNAEPLSRVNAAVVLESPKLTGESLEVLIVTLLDDGARRAEMSRAMRSWAPQNAGDAAAEQIRDLVINELVSDSPRPQDQRAGAHGEPKVVSR